MIPTRVSRSAPVVQAHVIGALMIRELHTRFGRHNIGYLWIFFEPMLLAVAVALLHSGHVLPTGDGIRPIPFAIGGYVLFILFRSTVSRAETLLEANRPLLYHRQVTLFDMVAARALLELASTSVVLLLLIGAAILMDYADPPADIFRVILSLMLMMGFAFGLSMIICALSHESPLVSRLVHPLLYLAMPISGAFYAVDWLPQTWRAGARWIPTVPIFEELRAGLFAGYDDRFAHIGYAASWCLALTLLGLLAMQWVRRRIDLA
jgi:capsular polysaccharide transport system permease protein